MSAVTKRAAELREQLTYHGHRYYVLDDPEIGDDAYDALLDELRRIEADHPELVTPDSPTQRVGAEPVSRLEKVRHPQPMLSLANARSEEELRAWVARMRSHLAREGIENPSFRFVCEPKIDGLAISLVYRDGQLERGATRGNGEVGEDVTHNLRTIPSIPLRVEDAPPLVEVRGEVYMSLPDFAALNERRAEQGLSTFMNPRNSAAGTIRQLDPKLAADRPLSMWCYGIGATDGTPVDCVRFAKLGLIEGFEADVVVSGINHGSNLGDDITYSGTVAAALEGVVLGIPGIAVSQQSTRREMDFRLGQTFDFTSAAEFTARVVDRLDDVPLPEGTLLNVNVPAGEIAGVEVARLGKRIYRDRLDLVDEDSGRRQFRIYGDSPVHDDEAGTDLAAVHHGRIAVTPLHFDLTDTAGVEALRGFDLDALLRPAAQEVE